MDVTIESLNRQPSGVRTPGYAVHQMQVAGAEDPRWLHIGPGNIFRIFLARIADDLLAAGEQWPITAVATGDPDKLDRQLRRHDLMTLGVTLHPDGHRDLRVIGGICEALSVTRECDRDRMWTVAASPRLALISLTITEKGYKTTDQHGILLPQVAQEVAGGPQSHPRHAMVLLAATLWHRYRAGQGPVTVLSFDNFHHNGDVTRNAVAAIIKSWTTSGQVSSDVAAWMAGHVTFPVTVIDKITPGPSPTVAESLSKLGYTDMSVQDVNGSTVAGFVNAEGPEYLIIEDRFAGDRPPLEDYGIALVSRQACEDFETMKVTTCLNPLHTALAVSARLLGIATIDQAMQDSDLAQLVHRLGWDEGMPVVTNPGVVDPADFLREVETSRFTNPYLPDDPARIASDTSQKLAIRFGETLKSYLDAQRDVTGLTMIPLVFAMWLRYLMGVDDNGEPFEVSPDPRREELQQHLAHIQLGTPLNVHDCLYPIASDDTIFGVDLYPSGLGQRVEELFTLLAAGPGAVRDTIHKEVTA